ncbi:hypothetical protein CKAH01_08109 [Colletotrichum kahawae]|uniref:Uncharacterized protein n=1 Tax=Colletotrichum kahawae TaxID=34407 RepID=A0AAE0D255_COLKA|nr:hypothetical protein CKAH01_08109 [Colletotrichum kahawae]
MAQLPLSPSHLFHVFLPPAQANRGPTRACFVNNGGGHTDINMWSHSFSSGAFLRSAPTDNRIGHPYPDTVNNG